MNPQNYIEVTKPRTVLLLVFTSVVTLIVASRLDSIPLTVSMSLLATLAITAGCAGCNAVTCYLDRDIDAVMNRTRNRPLPSKRIDPPQKALIFGLTLIALSLILALMRNSWAFVFMALGIFDNVVVYSLLLKRRNPVNIVLGGISGALPVAFGWAYVTDGLALAPILMAALVILWIPNHIWSLALHNKEDYEKAGVPMLPVVISEKSALRCIVSTSVLLVVFSLVLFRLGSFGLVYLTASALLGIPMLLLNGWLFVHPTRENAWRVFKFSSPYLAIIFLAMIIDALI